MRAREKERERDGFKSLVGSGNRFAYFGYDKNHLSFQSARKRVCEREIHIQRGRGTGTERESERQIDVFGDSKRVCQTGCVGVVWRARGEG